MTNTIVAFCSFAHVPKTATNVDEMYLCAVRQTAALVAEKLAVLGT
jgi:hypothetical protein